MEAIKDLFSVKASAAAAEIKELIKEHGDKKIGDVTLAQVYQGMRGITGLVTETSLLDAQEGIRFRGFSIPELQDKLPKAPGGDEPLPEGLFYLMMVGEVPTAEDVKEITSNWQRRSHVPSHVFDVIDALPLNTHPMTMFVAGVMALQTESKFSGEYAKGMNKKDYWQFTYDDSMDLIARLPRIAAYIYRRKYKNNEHIHPNGLLDLVGSVWQLTKDKYRSGSYEYIIMKGGSYFKPSGSWWYVQAGPRELTYAQYLLRVSQSFERNSTVGFRCISKNN